VHLLHNDTPVDISHPGVISMSKSLIRLTEVLCRTGYSKASIYRLIRQGRFPVQVKIGPRSVAFIESEVDEWINQRIEESRSDGLSKDGDSHE